MLVAPSLGAMGIAGAGPNPFAAGAAGAGGAAEPRPAQGEAGFHSAAPDAPTTAEAKRAIEKSLKDGMRTQDVNAGLGPEGPVLRALRDATYGSLAPDRGTATFLAKVDEGGTVIDLHVISSTGGEQGWSDARERALHLLKGMKLALRGGGAAEMRIAVQSDMRLPSGNTTGISGVTSGMFDVTDLSAKARRIVHARLVSITSL
jgi:hypothetical protein